MCDSSLNGIKTKDLEKLLLLKVLSLSKNPGFH